MIYFSFVSDRMRPHPAILILLVSAAALLPEGSANQSYSQEVTRDSVATSHRNYMRAFEDVETGVSTGVVAPIAKHFAPQIAIYLRGDENGTFSSNQAYYILENFLRTRRFAPFEFSSFGESDAHPYATGGAEFVLKGSREIVQVYVALTLVGGKYVIAQLNIY
jgi:hypothetical protein